MMEDTSVVCKVCILKWTIGRRGLCYTPPGFEIKGHELKMYRLWKTLYGLKQSPRYWNKRIYGFLIKAGFTKCTLEHEVCVNDANKLNQIIICVYMDDLLTT